MDAEGQYLSRGRYGYYEEQSGCSMCSDGTCLYGCDGCHNLEDAVAKQLKEKRRKVARTLPTQHQELAQNIVDGLATKPLSKTGYTTNTIWQWNSLSITWMKRKQIRTILSLNRSSAELFVLV